MASPAPSRVPTFAFTFTPTFTLAFPLPARLPSRQGLRGSVPPNFPYLNVEFGISDGFVHVVDDEEKFDPGLARSVMIGGCLGSLGRAGVARCA